MTNCSIIFNLITLLKYQVKKTETLQISNWDFFWFRIKGWINHKIVLTNFFLNSLEIVGGEKRQWVLFWGEMAGCGWGLGSKLVGGAVRAHENLTRIQNKVGETPNMRHLIPWGPRLSRATEDSHFVTRYIGLTSKPAHNNPPAPPSHLSLAFLFFSFLMNNLAFHSLNKNNTKAVSILFYNKLTMIAYQNN